MLSLEYDHQLFLSVLYFCRSREEWIVNWPGQIVLAIDQIIWTKEVHEMIRTGGSRGLREYVNVSYFSRIRKAKFITFKHISIFYRAIIVIVCL